MINTVVLDIGQVLAEFRWEDYIKQLGYDESMNERIAKATVLHEIWDELDRGELSQEEILEACCKLDSSISNEIRCFFMNICDIVKEFDYATSFIKNLKEQGVRVYLLSNYGKIPFEYAKTQFDFLQYVDGGVISYQVKQIKPEPEIYQTLISKYKINPTQAVFLDDRSVNLKTAANFGFHTILFTDLESAKVQLNEMGIKL